jgi:hypothetical protein
MEKINKSIFWTIISIFLITPLIFYTKTLFAFISVKELVLQSLVIIAMALWIIKIIFEEKFDYKKINVPVLLYLAFIIFSYLAFKYTDSYFLFNMIIVISLFFLVSNFIKTKKQFNMSLCI